MTPAPSRPNRFHGAPVDLAAMARRVIARDRGDEPGKLYPDILHGDRQACMATQKRLAVLLSDRATDHAVQAAQGAGDGSTEDLAEALNTLALTVADTPETAPWLIKLAEAEMATRPLEASPGVVAVLDTCGADQGSVESFLHRLVMGTKGTKTMRETPGETEPSTSEEGAES